VSVMGAKLLKYSNGWGHLIVTALVIAGLFAALLAGKITDTAAAAVLGPIIAFWFMSGSANRFRVLNPTTDKQIAPPVEAPKTPTQPLPGAGAGAGESHV